MIFSHVDPCQYLTDLAYVRNILYEAMQSNFADGPDKCHHGVHYVRERYVIRQHDDEDDESTMREALYSVRGNIVTNPENNGELVISESCQITDAAVICQAVKKPEVNTVLQRI